jgi:hypothetical protein
MRLGAARCAGVAMAKDGLRPERQTIHRALAEKIPPACQDRKPGPPNRRSQFHKRRQPFIRTYNEVLTVAPLRDD